MSGSAGTRSRQLTTFDSVATAPTATLTRAPFTTGPTGLLVEQAAQATGASPGTGMALCADTGDTNVQIQTLSRSVNPYCLWQQGSPAGIPSNATYLYNPATGLVLDIGNTDLNLNGYTGWPVQPAAVTAWSTGNTQPQMSWTFIPAPQP